MDAPDCSTVVAALNQCHYQVQTSWKESPSLGIWSRVQVATALCVCGGRRVQYYVPSVQYLLCSRYHLWNRNHVLHDPHFPLPPSCFLLLTVHNPRLTQDDDRTPFNISCFVCRHFQSQHPGVVASSIRLSRPAGTLAPATFVHGPADGELDTRCRLALFKGSASAWLSGSLI